MSNVFGGTFGFQTYCSMLAVLDKAYREQFLIPHVQAVQLRHCRRDPNAESKFLFPNVVHAKGSR